MLGNRKMKKRGKEIIREIEARQYAERVMNENKAGEVGLTQNLEVKGAGTSNADVLRRIMSFRHDLRENIVWILMGALILIIEYLVIGVIFTVVTAVFFSIIVRVFTARFYKVPMQYVLLIRIQEGKPTFVDFLGFPLKLFRYIDTEGLENMFRTPENGVVYLASDVEFDGEIPVKITFSWTHFPEYMFLLRKETYAVMAKYLNRLILIDFKLRELLDMNSYAIASEMTTGRLHRIGQGKTEDALNLHSERRDVLQEIAELMKKNDIMEKRFSEEEDLEQRSPGQ